MPFPFRKNRISGDDYQYTPLRDTNSDIRILVLNSKGICRRGCIDVSIFHVYLGTKPNFEILSCAYSINEKPVTIYVGLRRKRLRVPESLANALLQLQHPTDSRQLWIDAICIDQANHKEKSQHVANRMMDIYRKAPRVTYWLGPGDESSTTALNLLRHMSKMVVVDWSDKTINSSQDAKNAGLESWADDTSYLPHSDEQFRTILKFLSRDWFDRVWSMQEIWLTGLKAGVLCGKNFIAWVHFRRAIICLYLKSSSYHHLEDDHPERIEHIMKLCSVTGDTALSSLLDLVRAAKCSDHKDKVYSILNMLHPQYQLQIQPNYDKTTSEVYTDLVLRYIDQKSRLDILRGCYMEDRDNDIPSWVPNLAKEDTHKSFPEWSADADCACDAESYGEGVLKVSGRHVATVRKTQWIHFESEDDSEIISVIRQLALPNLDDDYVAGGSMFDAYCRTLGADQFSDMSWPRNCEWPNFELSQNVLRNFLDTNRPRPQTAEEGEAHFLHSIHLALQDSQFITTDEGYIGLGPRAIQAGDKVCVLPGSRGLVLLRPHISHSDRHEVVGQTFMYGLMKGEGLLGPLTDPYQAAMQQDPARGWVCGFLNRNTEKWRYGDDPRLNPFRDQNTYDQTNDVLSRRQTDSQTRGADSKLTVQGLRQEGIELQLFYLV